MKKRCNLMSEQKYIWDFLTEEDKELIDNYRENYVDRDTSNSKADLEYVLRHWNDAKSSFLQKVFKNQLIIKEDVVYYQPVDDLMEEIEKLDIYKKVSKEFYDFLETNATHHYDFNTDSLSDAVYPLMASCRYELMRLFSAWCLANNEYDDYTVKIEDPTKENGYLKVERGCKPVKVLGKINNIFHFTEDFEEFRVAISMILNKKKVEGNLCLSIHPLDYMTMSDNSCNWSSCMSWMDEGEYRQGTVEMMNSPWVVVAYLESKNPFRFYNNEWNNKKWRSLYIVNPQIICNIKGYPYQLNEVDNIVINKLRKMVEEAYGYKYRDPITKDSLAADHNVICSFSTCYMYNDFDTCTHYCAVNETTPFYTNDVNHRHHIHICYSGESECMWCGADNEDSLAEGSLSCSNCTFVMYCDCCGCRIYPNDSYYETPGGYICPECRNDYYREDFVTGAIENSENLTSVYVVPDEIVDNLDLDLFIYRDVLPYFDTYLPYYERKNKIITRYDGDIHLHEITFKENPDELWDIDRTYLYITVKELKELGDYAGFKRWFEDEIYEDVDDRFRAAVKRVQENIKAS